MKSTDLIRPFKWHQRQILIEDRIWYVPDGHFEDDFVFPGWHHAEIFAVNRPICVEYCSGNGAWISAKAQANPHQNWVGVEKKFQRVQKIWAKIKTFDLDNLLVLCGEGHRATTQYFPSASVSEVYVNFPDPWPKTRHAKHRIVQPSFIREIHRILKDCGTLTLVTDDEEYSISMIADVSTAGGFESLLPHPFFTFEMPNYGNSFFEDLWRQKGKSIRYHVFKKISDFTSNTPQEMHARI